MTTPAQLRQILARAEKETLTIELKRSDKLKDSDRRKEEDKRRDVVYEIVALANRRGGRLILGINNDGSFEGKLTLPIDEIKEIIDNICYRQISPLIDYGFEYLELEEGEVIIINIPKRGKIPCAYVNSKEQGEIKTRIYYIRTSHGKRLVNDNQLHWLFNYQEEANFTFKFRTIITFDKNSLSTLSPLEQPLCVDDYNAFVHKLAPKILEKLSFNPDFENRLRKSFFLGITPYVFIRNLSSYFRSGWLIEVTRRQPRGKNYHIKFISEGLGAFDIEKIYSDNIPKISGNTILTNLHQEIINLSIHDIAAQHFNGETYFIVPSGTEICINYENSHIFDIAKLIIKNKDFKFEFIFEENGVKPGPAHGNPIWEIMSSQCSSLNKIVNEHKIYKQYQSIEISGTFNATFYFPEEDTDLFEKYYHYAKSIQEILESEWDHDKFIESLPNSKFYVLESKLNTILQQLKQE